MHHYLVDPTRLRALIRVRGYPTLSAFAAAHRLSRATLQSYLRGQTPISTAFYHLAKALRVDPLTLLTLDTKSKTPPEQEILPIATALCRQVPQLAVGLFGSRATNRARTYSDWDLGITRGATALATADFLRCKRLVDDLAEDLPRRVDLINLDAAPTWFLEGIHYPPIFLGGTETSWQYFLGVLHGTQKAA